MLGPKPFVLHISYTESFIVFIIIEEVYQSIVHCVILLQSVFQSALLADDPTGKIEDIKFLDVAEVIRHLKLGS